MEDALVKQQELITIIQNSYTHVISAQEQIGDTIKFTTVASHNIKEYGRVTISGVKDANGNALADYNNAFAIVSIPDDTSFIVNKEQTTFTLSYSASAVFTSSSVVNLRDFNNMEIELSEEDLPAFIVDIDDTLILQTNVPGLVEDKTFYPIMVIHNIADFPKGSNVQVNECRKFVNIKFKEILELIDCKLMANIGRTETVWSQKKVSLVATTVKY